MKALKQLAAEVMEEEVKKSLSIFVEEYVATHGSIDDQATKEARIKAAAKALEKGLYAYRSALSILDDIISQFIKGGGEVG